MKQNTTVEVNLVTELNLPRVCCITNVFPSLSHGKQSRHSKAPAGQGSSTHAWLELCAPTLRATKLSMAFNALLDVIFLRKLLDDNTFCKFESPFCIHMCLNKSERFSLIRSV